MEPLFINEYPVTFALMKEWSQAPLTKKAINAKRLNFLIRMFGTIGSFLLFIGSLITVDVFYMVMGFLLLSFFLFRMLVQPELYLKKQYKKILDLLGGRPWVRKTAFAENIVIDDGRFTMRYEYTEIKEVKENSDCFILIGIEFAIRIRKDSFTLGTAADFRDFIYKKCNAISEIQCKLSSLATF